MSESTPKTISGKSILLLFVAASAVYAVMLLVTIPQVMAFADGMELLDMMPFGYEGQYVQLLFDTLGEEGRNVYLTRQLPLDMIYPGLFAASYSLIMVYFLSQMGKFQGWVVNLAFIPIVVGLADYLENAGIITMLLSYPNQTSLMVELTSLFSVVKVMSTAVYFVSLMVVLIAYAIVYFKQRN
ncbi:MAG: hypothetical protein ACI9EQ_002049 [Bacteroidia bacterium]|jgi:hypothetical protein